MAPDEIRWSVRLSKSIEDIKAEAKPDTDALVRHYDWSIRGNYRIGGLRIPLFHVYRFCQKWMLGAMCYGNVFRNVCTNGRDPQADRCRTRLANI